MIKAMLIIGVFLLLSSMAFDWLLIRSHSNDYDDLFDPEDNEEDDLK